MLMKADNPVPAAGIRAKDRGTPVKIIRASKVRDIQPRRIVFPTPRTSWYLSGKEIIDWFIAATLFLVAGPAILLCALLVKLTSSGPAFYSQTRVGRHGRLFSIYKLRSMIHNCESLTGPRWSMPGDPRVTWLGRILRLTHLDELPQLLNVLRGQMSLIGPRPERPEFLPRLDQAIPGYLDRLAIRPGVTGLAQVNLPADTELASVQRKLAFDLYYIRNLGFWLDLRILICTVLYSVGIPFRLSRRLFLLPSGSKVERALATVGETPTNAKPIRAAA